MVSYRVQCDSPKCGNSTHEYGTRRAALNAAKRYGWRIYREGESAYEWCRTCTEEADKHEVLP
jgi:hypothetical protein